MRSNCLGGSVLCRNSSKHTTAKRLQMKCEWEKKWKECRLFRMAWEQGVHAIHVCVLPQCTCKWLISSLATKPIYPTIYITKCANERIWCVCCVSAVDSSLFIIDGWKFSNYIHVTSRTIESSCQLYNNIHSSTRNVLCLARMSMRTVSTGKEGPSTIYPSIHPLDAAVLGLVAYMDRLLRATHTHTRHETAHR